MNRIALSIVTAAVLLAATGCGSTGAVKASSSTASPGASAAGTAPSSAPAAPSKKSALIVKFGETVEYADGIKITVEHAGTGIASPTAAPSQARGAEYQLFKITMVNGTAETFDPAAFYETAVHGPAGTPAEKVFDSAASIGAGNFTGIMVPGGTQTVTAGWLIPAADLASTTFTLRPSFKHNPAVVTGGL